MISEKYTEYDLCTANEQKTFCGDDDILKCSMNEIWFEFAVYRCFCSQPSIWIQNHEYQQMIFCLSFMTWQKIVQLIQHFNAWIVNTRWFSLSKIKVIFRHLSFRDGLWVISYDMKRKRVKKKKSYTPFGFYLRPSSNEIIDSIETW